jgi:hypothetical protein
VSWGSGPTPLWFRPRRSRVPVSFSTPLREEGAERVAKQGLVHVQAVLAHSLYALALIVPTKAELTHARVGTATAATARSAA